MPFNFLKKNLLEGIKLSEVIIIVLCIVLVIMVLGWIWSKLYLKERNCSELSRLYDVPPAGLVSIDPTQKIYCHPLRDFYISTAYNCCATGNYKNDFVSVCALKDCIKQGARCLDFEIYSLDNEPVIAVSDVSNYSTKGSFNAIPFSDALETIENYAFTSSHAPNNKDPLIIHLRIMSNNKIIYNKMAKNIYDTIENRVLGKEYSYEYDGNNLGQVSIKTFMEKIIIIADKSNALFEKTKLDEYINIASNTPHMRCMRFNQVKDAPSMSDLIEFNGQNMTICIPNLGITPENPSPMVAMQYGCQFVAMAFQNFDTNMEYYSMYFQENGSAFVLRPAELRYTPKTYDPPPPQDPKLGFGDKCFNKMSKITGSEGCDTSHTTSI